MKNKYIVPICIALVIAMIIVAVYVDNVCGLNPYNGYSYNTAGSIASFIFAAPIAVGYGIYLLVNFIKRKRANKSDQDKEKK